MSKILSAKYYQENMEKATKKKLLKDITICLIKKNKKSNNMVPKVVKR